MTSSNVSNLLVQVSQVDVSITSDKAASNVDAGLFEKTLQGVANKIPRVNSNSDSALPEKQVDKKATRVDVSKQNRNIKQEDKPVDENTAIVEKVEAVVKEVKEVIEEQLDVTEEDIELAMENLGLTFIDLLNPQSLAQLVSELTGETESITLVLSDDFAGILEKVTDLTNQLFEETNFSFDEIKDLVMQVNSQVVELPEMVEVPSDAEIPEVPEPEMAEDIQEVPDDENKSVTNLTQENLKPVEKQEAPVAEDTKPVVETEEVLKPVEAKSEQQESSFESEGKENSKEQVKMPEKTQNEPQIIRGEGILPPQQNLQLQFIADESVVALPTGETVRTEEIVNQLVEQAKIMTDSESTTMEMTLNPEGLGKIYLEVTQKGQEITAKIFTENDAVKHALESQMASLRTEMNQTSAKVTSIEVSVGTHEFERNLDENGKENPQNQEQASGRSNRRNSRINLNSLDDLTGLATEEDILIAQMMKDNGGTLDFMA